jgi:hypothetical protein
MSTQLIIVFLFTFSIHLVNTLSYSVRLVGIRTGRLAVSFALFNILVLSSRASHALQAPLLAKEIEKNILTDQLGIMISDFRWLLIAASLGTLLGAFLIPTFQNIFFKIVTIFNAERSVPKLILHGFTWGGVKQIRDNFKVPSKMNIIHFKDPKTMPKKIIVLNFVTVAILTVGVFSALYAGILNPDLRTTSGLLAPVITGFATILLVIFIDPYFSLLTDDVLEGKTSETYFHKCLVLMVSSRFAGTLLAQLLLIPAAEIIVTVGKII